MASEDDPAGRLETILGQMQQRVRGVPFPLVVKALARKEVIPFDHGSAADQALLAKLDRAVAVTMAALKDNPIERSRPNEVGNDVEHYVRQGLTEVGFACARPVGSSGAGKASGYPDLVFSDDAGRTVYLECKSMAASMRDTTFRSFYVSPSDSFKVTKDAIHLLMAFEMERRPGTAPGLSRFVPTAYKLVDLSLLECDIKYEFNSDNRRLYAEHAVLLATPE